MEKLSLILWRERELLETLRYRLEVEQLVMSNGKVRWLAAAAGEVESALEEIRSTELLRAVVVDEVAATLGLEPGASLASIIERVDEPWDTILAEHRDFFLMAGEDLARLAEGNRTLISAGLRAARETLLGLGGGLSTYAEDGRTVVEPARAGRVDRSL